MRQHLLLFLICLGILFNGVATLTAQTVVRGRVLDAENDDPLPYATVQFGNGQSGTRTDIDGYFRVESPRQERQIRVSYVGYVTQTIEINGAQELVVRMTESNKRLGEVVIRPEKYKKDNPAVDLIELVFANKDKNRKEGLDFYQFEKHERLQFDINGVTDAFRNRWYFRPFKFAFEYCDTNLVNQKVILPFYLRERLLDDFYRKLPKAKKEWLHAERQTAFDQDYDVDQDGVSTYLNSLAGDIDIYEPVITLLDKEFIGPLSSRATAFYRFYINDTVEIDNKKFADIFFAPKNKNDIAFMGNILVALDSTYAVRRVEMGISKDINVNWLSDLHIEQEFDFVEDGPISRLLLFKDVMTMDLKIWKNREGRSLQAIKTNSYKHYKLNQPAIDTIYESKIPMLRDTGYDRKADTFWIESRHQPLTDVEQDIAVMVDSVKNTRIFKYMEKLGYLMSTGHYRFGPIEVGELGTFYSFNPVEGNRFRLAVRTNRFFSKRVRLRAFTAYGTKDQAFKYGGNVTYAMKGRQVSRFPVHQVRASYERDLRVPGLGFGSSSLITSIQQGNNNRMLFNQIIRAEYTREWETGFSYSLNTSHTTVQGAGVLGNGEFPGDPNIGVDAVTTEVGGWMRYAPKQRFIQGSEQRISFNNRAPVFYFQYRAGLKNILGGDYAFQSTSLNIDKNFYLNILGKASCNLEFGGVFGQVSYPFLQIHRANQSFFFDNYGFNMMNYLEFVSDRYMTFHLNHDFNGLLFNRIPGIKKMKLREGITFKALYGSLSDRNTPTAENQLQPFPTDDNGQLLTRGLAPGVPYFEASAGVGNIFGFLRLDYVWRLSYLDAAGIRKGGIRILFSSAF
jgi:Family of unknown function (DUF5686)/CarboxypepD_reg-like domain